MAGRKKQGKKPNGALRDSPSPTPEASPIVLVPATPTTPGEIPIATEDEATPTPQAPTSPTSYASIAALPAARMNVVVWPPNPATTASAPSSPVLGQRAVSPAAGNGVTQTTSSAATWPETQTLEARRDTTAKSETSSLPSSSPIHYPSTTASTPAPMTDLNDLINSGLAASQGVTSYEDFWAQVNTPPLHNSNMPSALQTPRLLTPLPNNDPLDALWPAMTHTLQSEDKKVEVGDENCPPAQFAPDSHPPIASRMRKRRRGASPIVGERNKKSAKRRGKARAAGQVNLDGPEIETANPWSTSTAGSHAVSSMQAVPPPSFVPSIFLQSTNHTPYDNPSSSGSIRTSFYYRPNESGSFPTPHRMSDTPPSPSVASTSNITALQLLTSPTASAPIGTAETMTETTRHHPMDVDWSERGGPRMPTGSNPNSAASPCPQDATMELDRTHAEPPLTQPKTQHSQDVRRRVRSLDGRPESHRSPMVEGLPEEGEIPRARWDDARDMRRRVQEGEHDQEARRGAYSDIPRADSTRYGRETESPWTGYTSSQRSSPRGRRSISEDRHTEIFSFSPSNRSLRDDYSAAWAAPNQPFASSLSPQPRTYRNHHPSSQNPATVSATLTNRVSSLDVFDVGDDDNLPDAVRRGGPAAEGEEESPTPIPHEGDPEVHLHDPEAHLRGMSDMWVQAVWADPSDSSITLSTFNPRYTRSYGANKRTASDLRKTIAHITGETEFLVIAPDQAPDHRGRGPVEWAITGLTSEGVGRLLRRRVWSFKSITFFPRRRTLENPRWLLALEGFLEDNVSNIEAAVRSTFERPQVRQRIEQMIRANPEYNRITTAEAFRRIMATLRVTVYTLDNETVVANVFLQSPTQSIRVWRRWIQELRDLTFGSYHTAIARVRRISTCAGCLGVDHPSHLCPFPGLPYWNGPETAGGSSYSVDGREKRTRHANESMPPPSDAYTQRRLRSQSAYGQDSTQSGPPSQRRAQGDSNWERHDSDRGRDGGREHFYEQRRKGPLRRGKKDDAVFQKYDRDSQRRDGRR